MTVLERAANALRELWLARNDIPTSAALRWDQLKPSEREQWIDRANTAITPRKRRAA